MRAGTHGVIDCLAVDRDGAIVIVAAAQDPDAALAQLLDQYLWAVAECDLLARAYPQAGVGSHRAIRCMIVAPSFDPAFLDRIGLLTVSVQSFVARPIPSTEPPEFLVEPSEALYGRLAADPAAPGAGSIADPALVADPWPFPLDPDVDAPLPMFPGEGPAAEEVGLPDLDGEVPAAEPLTSEELEEFELFDRRRHVRDGAP